MLFNKVAIIGFGLLGGSFALALKKKYGNNVKIVAIGRDKKKLENALNSGMADEIYDSRIDGVAGANLIVIATPVKMIFPVLEEIAPFVEEGTLVTDFGSTKKEIVSQADDVELINAMFVGCHPIAGGEESGYQGAREDLFDGKSIIITKSKYTVDNGISVLEALWRDLGAVPVVMSPDEHDAKLGLTSHLVHLAASALVGVLKEEGEVGGMYGTGFLDTTRIAQGDEKIWTDIVKTNNNDIIQGINRYIGELDKLRKYIEASDYERLEEYLKEMKDYRKTL